MKTPIVNIEQYKLFSESPQNVITDFHFIDKYFNRKFHNLQGHFSFFKNGQN